MACIYKIICVSKTFEFRVIPNFDNMFFSMKRPFFDHACVENPELPSNLSTMDPPQPCFQGIGH